MSGGRVGLVLDSGAELGDRPGQVVVVPMHVVIGGVAIAGTGDGDVYSRLRRGERVTTSTPSPGDYMAAFERLADTCDAVVCLTIPARWSGTFASATVAARLFSDGRESPTVDVVETPTAAAAYGLVARVAAGLIDAGADRSAVLERIGRACGEVRMYGALETLEYVARSGRVPALIAGISDALRVRPVFSMHGGRTGRVALARTEGGALRALERVAREQLDAGREYWLMLFHADAAQRAAVLREQLLATCAVVRDETVALAPVIGVYTGPGAVGFAAVPLESTDPVTAP